MVFTAHTPLGRQLGRLIDLKQKSLLRANLLVIVSLLVALLLSDFPHNRPTLLLMLPAFSALAGTADTIRNMRRVYSFYHAGVILCVYMDLMAIAMILFFLVYPYSRFLTSSH